MNNKGSITVFLSLIFMAMLVFIIAAISYVDICTAKIKASAAVGTGTGSVKASFNTYIFDNYHILLIDKDFRGRGEGYIEEIIEGYMSDNLGPKYTVRAELGSTHSILEDDLEGLKKQINEDIKYEVAETYVNKLKDKANGNDEPVTDKIINEMDEDVSGESLENSGEKTQTGGKNAESSGEKTQTGGENTESSGEKTQTGGENAESSGENSQSKEDPRRKLKQVSKIGIAYYIKPQDICFSDEDMTYVSTAELVNEKDAEMDTDIEFSKYDALKKDVKKGNGWINKALGNGQGIYYAMKNFNNALTKNNSTSKLNMEIEYLIGGKKSDAENYKRTINKLLTLRLGLNYASLLKDTGRMQVVRETAAGLTAVTFVPYPILKYLLAGCWAYVEGIADCYFLIRGYKIPYIKRSTNWMTDIDSLAGLNSLEPPKKDENGMDYQDYLAILLGINSKNMYYRMLDLMCLNADVNPENLIDGFYVNITVNYEGREFCFGNNVSY